MRDLRGNRRIVDKRSKRDDQSAVMLSCHRRKVALGYTRMQIRKKPKTGNGKWEMGKKKRKMKRRIKKN